jgi:hypothetical protein
MKTRNNSKLFQPQSNLSVCQNGPHYAGIGCNDLPTQMKLLSSNSNQFTKALKDSLQLHSFCTLAKYLSYNRN